MSQNKLKEERGVVSIIVTIILMLVISLIVLGFSQLTRRNERQTLNNQLSTQAYYAAETGVNDVRSAISNGQIDPKDPSYTTNCSTLIGDLTTKGYASNLSTTPAVSYSCALLNSTPSTIDYDLISNQKAVSVPLTIASGNLTSLTITWHANSATSFGTSTCGSATTLPTAAAWSTNCHYAMLHVDLTKDPSLVGNAAQNLSDSTDAFYLRPSSGGGTQTISSFTTPSQRAFYAPASCDAAGKCSMVLTLAGGVQGNQYYLRISTVYDSAKSVEISGVTTTGPASFVGAQTMVDVTGKAQGQLRRIQVRLPAQSSIAASALQSSGEICKIMAVISSIGVTDSCTVTGLPTSGSSGQVTGNALVGTIPCSVNCVPFNGTYPTYPLARYVYKVTYQNQTQTNGLTIASCLWTFGDGTPPDPTNCQPKDYETHNFALPGDTPKFADQVTCKMVGGDDICTPTGVTSVFPLGCDLKQPDGSKVLRNYKVVLTVFFTNGTTTVSTPINGNLPFCY